MSSPKPILDYTHELDAALNTALVHRIANPPPFDREAFAAYVRAMPQGEAQTALIFLVNFLADQAASACIYTGCCKE